MKSSGWSDKIKSNFDAMNLRIIAAELIGGRLISLLKRLWAVRRRLSHSPVEMFSHYRRRSGAPLLAERGQGSEQVAGKR